MAGTFVKTPTGHTTEILGLPGFDFVVFDMEHAAIGIGALDRVVLDLGATGILVSHVSSAARVMIEAPR